MKKSYFLTLLGIVVVGALGLWLWRSQDTSITPPNTNPTPEENKDINVTAPQASEVISSPLTVTGEARGTWYFEASFPVRVEDATGKVLGEAPATAQGEWMTTNMVPFNGIINFATSTTQMGFVVFAKDNPSGLPEHDAAIRVPITFALTGTPQTATVKVFFHNEGMLQSGQDICNMVVPVTRTIPATLAVGRAALEELLKGPILAETTAGHTTSIPAGVKVNKLIIANSVAKVDFSAELDKGIAGSCRVTAIKRQITETLQQFPTVKSVVISINGASETILQP